jgi:hypothetical protein
MVLIMEKELFRFFFRKNYKVEVSNDDLDEIGKAFNKYLKEKCNPEALEKFMPKSSIDVMMNQEHPLKHNGFHPALLIHFDDFVKFIKQQEKMYEKD